MVAFPTDIRYLDAATFEEEHEDVALPPAKMEGGYTITRPRFTRAPRRTFRWRYVNMRDSDKAALIEFWDSVKGGSNLFDWTHPVTAAVITCRFHETKLNFKRVGVGPLNIWESDTISIQEV